MDYREMTRLAADPFRVRATAALLIIKLDGDNLPDWMRSFLADLSKYDGSKRLSPRQLETLFSLRERASRSNKVGPYSADHLIKLACERRRDLLDDEAEAWLEELHLRGKGIALSRSEKRRLIALCRRLDIILEDEWIHLD